MRDEAVRVDHQAGQEELVHHRLLEPVGEARETRQVLEDGDRVPDVLVRHADPLRRAEDEVVLVRHVADVVRGDLGVGAEEAVAVDRRARRYRGGAGVHERRARNDALEVRGLRRELMDRQSVRVELEARGRGDVVDVALDGERAGDAPEDAAVDLVLDQRDDERGRRRVEAVEGVVTDMEQPLGKAPLAGGREVPRQVEVVACDAGRGEVREDLLHVRTALLDDGVAARRVVAIREEGAFRRERIAGRILQVPHRDDVAGALFQIDRRPDDERALRLRGRVRVELDEHELLRPGAGLDEDDRRPGVERTHHVRDRRCAGLREVDVRNVREDRRADAEAVVPVVVARLDRDVRRVPRHAGVVEVDPLAGVLRRVRDGEPVVREGVHALARIEEVARAGAAERARAAAGAA